MSEIHLNISVRYYFCLSLYRSLIHAFPFGRCFLLHEWTCQNLSNYQWRKRSFCQNTRSKLSFINIYQENKASNRRYGRTLIAGTYLPYFYACGIYRGYVWKGLLFYLIYREVDAIYDAGIYLRFLVNGPR